MHRRSVLRRAALALRPLPHRSLVGSTTQTAAEATESELVESVAESLAAVVIRRARQSSIAAVVVVAEVALGRTAEAEGLAAEGTAKREGERSGIGMDSERVVAERRREGVESRLERVAEEGGVDLARLTDSTSIRSDSHFRPENVVAAAVAGAAPISYLLHSAVAAVRARTAAASLD